MNAGADVNANRRLRIADLNRPAMQCEPIKIFCRMKKFGSPAMLFGGGFNLTQRGADVNRLAVVAAVIFTEFLHVENFTQRREDAKKFLTRISRINTDV